MIKISSEIKDEGLIRIEQFAFGLGRLSSNRRNDRAWNIMSITIYFNGKKKKKKRKQAEDQCKFSNDSSE
ncbi:unnamed protein product [Adineta ricciae]|uniref:Uncharacterized protein n=1 Tax=Adineta ricciae TaxID=249248 RepID=A0A813XER0_ADIRI|nr:unnamed protein product [Adineta ricciae]